MWILSFIGFHEVLSGANSLKRVIWISLTATHGNYSSFRLIQSVIPSESAVDNYRHKQRTWYFHIDKAKSHYLEQIWARSIHFSSKNLCPTSQDPFLSWSYMWTILTEFDIIILNVLLLYPALAQSVRIICFWSSLFWKHKVVFIHHLCRYNITS